MNSDLSRTFVKQVRHSIAEHHLPRITRCLRLLSEEEIWWRPNRASNSVGNLVLHLSGNVRQWVIAGLGRRPDVRDRKQEFAERGPVARRELIGILSATVNQAARVIARLDT